MTATLRQAAKPGQSAVGVTVADLYMRLSDLRTVDLNEDGHGKTFKSRETKLRAFAAQIGYEVGIVVVENDEIEKVRVAKGKTVVRKVRGASAFKRKRQPDGTYRVYRPGFRKILDRLDSGVSNALLAEDLDRVIRDEYDAADLLAIAARRKVNVRSLTGTLTLTDGGTPDEQFMVRMLVNIANKASEDTARRVSAARERNAFRGEFGGGRRPFGFESDGITKIPDECAVIAQCSARVLQIDGRTSKNTSLRSLAAELREGSVPTVTGVPWTTQTLRGILLRPRNAGLMVYQGEILESAPCPWEPIVDRAVYDAVVAVLTDPSRRCGTDPAPKYLGTNLYRCGLCTPPDTEQVGHRTLQVQASRSVYRCSKRAHLICNQPALDTYVVAHVLSLLSLPDAADLFLPAQPDVDAPKLRTEADALQVRLNSLVEMFADGLITRSQLTTGTQKAQARLAEITRELTTAVVDSPLAGLAAQGVDVATWWETLPLANKRVVVDSLVTITVMPTKVYRGFDTSRVIIEPKNKWNEATA